MNLTDFFWNGFEKEITYNFITPNIVGSIFVIITVAAIYFAWRDDKE